jgi:hypothetical protein
MDRGFISLSNLRVQMTNKPARWPDYLAIVSELQRSHHLFCQGMILQPAKMVKHRLDVSASSCLDGCR